MMITFYDYYNGLSEEHQEIIIDFLFNQLDKYGDPRDDIRKALQYALKGPAAAGGFVCTFSEGKQLTGVAVVNRTGMEGYIPENILVYIAVLQDFRGKGIGRSLLTEVIRHAEGGIALHVEPDNPALFLYKNLGFENKYLEMRLNRKEKI